MGNKSSKYGGVLRLRPEWFNIERTKNYECNGDAYNDDRYRELAQRWDVDVSSQRVTESKDRYFELIKKISTTKWIHLRLLADFMQIGKIPRSWETLESPDQREQRWRRTEICVLEYSNDDTANCDIAVNISVKERRITGNETEDMDVEQLKTELHSANSLEAILRLYMVEDLSRNFIEAMGTDFGIEPDFFRAYIVDYAWHNVRDRWREPPSLKLVKQQRKWFRIRYVTARYLRKKATSTKL